MTKRIAKKVVAQVKLQVPAGKANPSPPVGPALGQHGVNIMEFCKAFNGRTQGQEGMIIPVVITIYSDRSFTFITKTPPASVLLKKAAKVVKGSGVPNRNKVGKVTQEQVREIAELKRQIAVLARQSKVASKAISKRPQENAEPPPARFVAKGLRSLRARLGLSAADFGKLAGASGQSIYNWESGKAVPRKTQLTVLAGLRTLGKREAQARLAELDQ